MSDIDDLTLPTHRGLFNYRVAYLLFRNDRVLIHGDPIRNFCYTPGGRVKFGESSQDAVIRELKEETGINEYLGFKFSGTVENFFFMDNTEYHEILFVYTAELDHDVTLPDTDEMGKPIPYQWVSEEEMKTLNVKPTLFKNRIFEFRKKFLQVIHKDF